MAAGRSPRARSGVQSAAEERLTKTEPMLARTALAESGQRSPGPGRRKRQTARRRAHDRSNVRRIPHAVEVNGPLAPAVRRALRPDGDHAGAGTKRRDLIEQVCVDLLPVEPAAGGAEDEARIGAGRPGRPLSRSSPSVTNSPSRSRSRRRASLRTSFSFSFVGLVITSVLILRTKRADLLVRPGEVALRGAARRPHPPGLARQIGETHRGR